MMVSTPALKISRPIWWETCPTPQTSTAGECQIWWILSLCRLGCMVWAGASCRDLPSRKNRLGITVCLLEYQRLGPLNIGVLFMILTSVVLIRGCGKKESSVLDGRTQMELSAG
jgi:hypothetical protein